MGDLSPCALFPQLEIGVDPDDIARWAREVERMGYEQLAVHDHVLGADPDRPNGWAGPHPNVPHTDQDMFHEPFVLFGYLAAVTTTIRLTTAILVLAQRQTALVAKQAAEVDVLTRGRLRLGVGIGWNRVEYQGMGADYTTRGRRVEEQISLLRRLWSEPTVDFTGTWHRIDRAGLTPLPVQRPIPIWMGGGYVAATRTVVEPALRRIARLAQGWLTHVQSGDAAAINEFRRYIREAGRDKSEVGLEGRISVRRVKPAEWGREIDWWRKVGATHIELDTMRIGYSSLDEHLDALGKFVDVLRAG